jgi:ornithine carbamoyltransferase
MPSLSTFRPARASLQCLSKAPSRSYHRHFSSTSSIGHSASKPRHFLSIADLSPDELTALVLNASSFKTALKSGSTPKTLRGTLQQKTVAIMFNKLSTRTRVSTEAAIATMGGHPMFLGKNDIQLGVNETLHDTSRVISSMVSCIVARVGPHSDIEGLAKDSSVPVINGLSNDFHPLQTIADFLTIYESFILSQSKLSHKRPLDFGNLKLEGLKIAWVGDSNNVLFDLAIAAIKLGVNISVASPKGYTIPPYMLDIINKSAEGVQSPGKLTMTSVPEEAIKNADILVTDTWVSMGQEEESARRVKAFEGYQITNELAARGGAKKNWKFMHCLPRHQEEVDDEVFYGSQSLVFPEAENRLYAAISALEAFVVNRGHIFLATLEEDK